MSLDITALRFTACGLNNFGDVDRIRPSNSINVTEIIRRKTGDHDALYGSVTNADVADELEKKGYQIENRKIQMGDHIKTLEEFDIPIRLFKDVMANVKLKVEREVE